ncbi:hypothetical protein ACFLX9_02285 [Chloroflexota bacterium]
MLTLYIVVGIVLFFILILSIPIEMAFDTSRPGAKARVGWAFGLLWKDVGGKKKKPKRPKKKRPKKKKRGPGAKASLTFLETRGIVSGLLKLARRMIGSIRVKQLNAHLRMGLDDPADTGILYSVICPILIPLNYIGSSNVRMDLCFEEAILDFTGQGHVRVVPAQMIWAVLLFGLSPAGLRAIRKAVVRRWR